MLSSLLIILAPLLIGYAIVLRQRGLLARINQALSAMVYLILFLMGISLALLDNLATNLLTILHYSVISIITILLCNTGGLALLERVSPWRHPHRQQALPSRLAMALESLKLCAVVAGGFALGLTKLPLLEYATRLSEYTLLLLLLLVGLQLRNSAMTLKQILLNRHGMQIAIVVALTSLAAGVINALLLGLPVKTGMAMASGFGWYSLSGILMSDAFGPVIGSATFFNDLARELLAIMLIPALMQRSRSTALGICGATSMDFTLPVLQRSGGLDVVPAAIVHGFILSLLTPLLMAFFSA